MTNMIFTVSLSRILSVVAKLKYFYIHVYILVEVNLFTDFLPPSIEVILSAFLYALTIRHIL